MRQAIAADFGLGFDAHTRFDRNTMTITGCKCSACWKWKTALTNRQFWAPKEQSNG